MADISTLPVGVRVHGAYKYPSDLTTPPHEKWILLEAKSGRHVMRDGFVAEAGNNPDRTLAAVALYLPTDALKSAHTATYTELDLGIAAGKAVEAAFQSGGTLREPTMSGPSGSMVDTLMDVAIQGGAGIAAQFARGAVNQIAGQAIDNPEFVAERILGAVVNPRTDTAFGSMQYRQYEFNFNLIPRDKQEADNIDAILNILHFYSLPSYGDSTNATNLMIGYPYEFVITMFNETHINKIERSVLTGITVDHAGGDVIAFATDYYPAATSLMLSFKEVRLLGRDSEVIFRGVDESVAQPGPGTAPGIPSDGDPNTPIGG
jgi:hypothetical protein